MDISGNAASRRPATDLIRQAGLADIEAAHAVRLAAAADLTRRFGPGHWTAVSDISGLRLKVAEGSLYVAEMDGATVGTFIITAQRISFYRPEWFAQPDATAAYVMDMSVHPDFQRSGIGRRVMEGAEQVARAYNLSGIRLDAYQGPAGAGPFYRKCGFRFVHAGDFRGILLEYYEKEFVADRPGSEGVSP